MENHDFEIESKTSIDGEQVLFSKTKIIEKERKNSHCSKPILEGVLVTYFISLLLSKIVFFNDNAFFEWFFVCITGNLAIGYLVFKLHSYFNTERFQDIDDLWALKNFGNFVEVILFSILLSFGGIVLLVGIFIAKSIGNTGNEKNTGYVVAIYRLGLMLQVILVIISSSLFLVHSNSFQKFKMMNKQFVKLISK